MFHTIIHKNQHNYHSNSKTATILNSIMIRILINEQKKQSFEHNKLRQILYDC
jgi:hypothetical protein